MPAACSEWSALKAGAHIAELAAREHAAVLRARLAWEAVKHPALSAPETVVAREQAATWYETAVDHLARQIPWALELARIYPNMIAHVTESHETFNRLTFATRLRIRREELERIRTVAGPNWDEHMTLDFRPHLPATIGRGANR